MAILTKAMQFRNTRREPLARFFLLLVFLSVTPLHANEAKKPDFGWHKEILGTLNFSQNNFDNWTQGGEDSWSWINDIQGRFDYKQSRYSWNNSLKLSYGRTKIGDKEAKKASDELKFDSVFNYKMSSYVNPYVAFAGNTQFTRGYHYSETGKTAVSDFMDPAYFIESTGFGYEPNNILKSRFGGALKETITSGYPVPYADDPKTEKLEKTKVEGGLECVTDLSTNLGENIVFFSKLELFSNLASFDRIDVNWDNLFSSKISKYLSVSLRVRIYYDRDISRKRQLKQLLALGLSYMLL
ncbi:DUF3078 domain-containing protein [Candidatus Omnitrophota bacterium]